MPQTAQEQLILEMINRARLDPVAEAARHGIDLNEGLAPGTITAVSKQPLAGNTLLTNAARGHSQHMLNVDRFGHTDIGDGTPGTRMTDAGYVFSGAWARGENIAFAGSTATIDPNSYAALNQNNLFIDKDYAGRGHRVSMLSDNYREIGVGELEGVYTSNGVNFNAAMLTQNFAKTGTNVFITGVAITDANNNDFYDIGEGRGNIAVSVKAGATVLGSDVTEAAGGYGVAVAPSTSPVAVRFSGGGLATAVEVSVTAATGNVKVDLLGANEILSSGSTVMGAGAVQLGLLGTTSLSATGNDLGNVIRGNKAANFIFAQGGNDVVDGGAGNDAIYGGIGRDVVTGGSGNDSFRFLLRDVGNTATTRDVITDFLKTAATGFDRIDLSAIDAKSGAGTTNDTFTFQAGMGAGFTAQGQIRWYQENPTGTANDKTIVAANLDTNLATSEFQIELKGLIGLVVGDFVL